MPVSEKRVSRAAAPKGRDSQDDLFELIGPLKLDLEMKISMIFNGFLSMSADFTSVKCERASLRFFIWDELPNQDFYVMHPSKFGPWRLLSSAIIGM